MPLKAKSRKYVITGGPGSGKSTLISALENAGIACSAEISRQTIQAEVAKGTDCLPWADIRCFSAKVFNNMIRAWKDSGKSELTFFDRGFPDVIAYLKMAGFAVPPVYLRRMQHYLYEQEVFILPPWEEIYVNDSERWQTYEEASAVFSVIRETYTGLGFSLIEVPKASPELRAAFVLAELGI